MVIDPAAAYRAAITTETLPNAQLTRQIERIEVTRAIAAQQTCEFGHEDHAPADEVYERKWRSAVMGG